jgi:hypothetical protein
MKCNSVLILIILAISLLPVSFADTIYGTAGQQAKLYGDVFSGTDYYNAASANVTIINSNLSTVITNQGMTKIATGRLYYNYTPTLTGEYYVTVRFYDISGTLLGTGSNLLEVTPINFSGSQNMSLEVIITIIVLIIFILLVIFKVEEKYGWIKVIGFIFCFVLILLAAFASVESQKVCVPTYNSGVLAVSCATSSNVSGTILYTLMLYLLGAIVTYSVIFALYQAIKYFIKIGVRR